jgi:large subunit ribosomal protein L1
VPIGKTSFDLEKLAQNLTALMDAIRKARPSAAKGNFVKRVTLTSTMGPAVRVDTNQAMAMTPKE